MKTNIVLPPLVVAFDEDEDDYMLSFGVMPREQVDWMRGYAQRMREAGDVAVPSDVFVHQLQAGEITAEQLLALAAFGAQEYWQEHGGAFALMLEAEMSQADQEAP